MAKYRKEQGIYRKGRTREGTKGEGGRKEKAGKDRD